MRLVLGSIWLIFLVGIMSRVESQPFGSPAVDRAALEMRSQNNVSEELLARDRAVINSAYPGIKAEYDRKGFSDSDVDTAVATGWKSLRVGPKQAGLLNAEMVKAYVNSLGKLRIESEPTAATVRIDADRLENPTNTSAWLSPGTYRIYLMKDGFVPDETRVTVVEGNNPPVKRVLRRWPK